MSQPPGITLPVQRLGEHHPLTVPRMSQPPSFVVRVIGVAGPSGSGKSTLAQFLASPEMLCSPCSPIQMDDFFNIDYNHDKRVRTYETPEGIFAKEYALEVRNLIRRIGGQQTNIDLTERGESCNPLTQAAPPAGIQDPKSFWLKCPSGGNIDVMAPWWKKQQAASRSSSETRGKAEEESPSSSWHRCSLEIGTTEKKNDGQPPQQEDHQQPLQRVVYIVLEGFLLAYFPEVVELCDDFISLFDVDPELCCVRRFRRGRPSPAETWELMPQSSDNSGDTWSAAETRKIHLEEQRASVLAFLERKIPEVEANSTAGVEETRRLDSEEEERLEKEEAEMQDRSIAELQRHKRAQARISIPSLLSENRRNPGEHEDPEPMSTTTRLAVVQEELLEYCGLSATGEESGTLAGGVPPPTTVVPRILTKASRVCLTEMITEFQCFRASYFREVLYFFRVYLPQQQRLISERCSGGSAPVPSWYAIQNDGGKDSERKGTRLDPDKTEVVKGKLRYQMSVMKTSQGNSSGLSALLNRLIDESPAE